MKSSNSRLRRSPEQLTRCGCGIWRSSTCATGCLPSGVAAVEVLGGYLRQFQIQLDPERMSARHVSLDEVMHAAEGANINAAGGFIVQGSMEWTQSVGLVAFKAYPT